MIKAHYNESDSWITKDDNGKDLDEPYYDEMIDEWNLDTFKEDVELIFEKRKFPLVLVANNSTWNGRTGYAKADSIDDIYRKLFSFDSSYYKLYRTRGGALHFTLATHDVPTGFSIDIKPFNKAYWE